MKEKYVSHMLPRQSLDLHAKVYLKLSRANKWQSPRNDDADADTDAYA